MKRSTKIWLAVATLLVIGGLMIFTAALVWAGWDIDKLSTDKYETNRYEITEEFESISVVTDTADIVFVPSEDGKCTVVCYEQEYARHEVKVADNKLTVQVVDERSWYEHIGISFNTPKITVSLPHGEYGDLYIRSDTGDVKIPEELAFKSIVITESTGRVKCNASAAEIIRIKTSTGSIKLEGISADSVELSVSTGRITVTDLNCRGDVSVKASTGKVKLEDVRCGSFSSKGNTGDITLKGLVAETKLFINSSTGDVELEGCDAAEIFINTDTGDVEGTLLSEKVFVTETDTGDVDVPKTTAGGRCEISTDTGDIEIRIKRPSV